MTKQERKWLTAIVKYKRTPQEIVYDEWSYKRMQAAYRGWIKSVLKGRRP